MVHQLQALLPDLLNAFPGVRQFYLFGSFAAGAAGDDSDVDVAVFIDETAVGDELLDLRLAVWLQERLERGVDVVIMNRVSPVIQHEVLREGIRLFERSPELRAKDELRAFKEYLDVRHFQRKRMKQEYAYGQ